MPEPVRSLSGEAAPYPVRHSEKLEGLLDVFDNPNAEIVLERIAGFTDADAEFFVFGVVTEYCVRLAAKGLLDCGRPVALVRDAIETLEAEVGRKAIGELTSLGARLVTTDQALAALDQTTTHPA